MHSPSLLCIVHQRDARINREDDLIIPLYICTYCIFLASRYKILYSHEEYKENSQSMHVTYSSLAVFYVPVYLLFGAQFWRHCPFLCRFLLNRHLRLLNLPSPLRQLNFSHTLLVELLFHGVVAFCQLAMYCASARCKDQQSGSSHNSGICTSCVFLASRSKILYSHKNAKKILNPCT